MGNDRWTAARARCALVLACLICSCSRERASVPDTSAHAPDANVLDAAVTLDERCKHHEDCVAVNLYPDGELRCCLACIPQRAANKQSADLFIAQCARERAMRECPVYDCVAPELDPRCVGGKCLLAPRAK